MQNSKLIQVLKTFTKDEWKGYEKLVASPFFNKGRNLMPFVKALKKFHPHFVNEKMTKEYIYSKVYKDKKYNNNTMKSAIHSLTEMAKEFLIQKDISMDNYKQLNLTKQLSSRKIDSLFEKECRSTLSESNRTGFSPKQLDFERELIIQNSLYWMRKNELRKYFPLYCQTMDIKFLSAVLEIYKAKAACLTFEENYNYAAKKSIAYNIAGIINYDYLYEFIRINIPGYFEYFEIYHLILKGGNEPDNLDNIEILSKKFFKLIDKLSHTEKFDIFRFIESFYILMERRLSISLVHKRAALYKEVLKRDLYYFDPEWGFSESTFINFVLDFLRTKDIESAEEFINKYYEKIPKNSRKTVYNYSKAFTNWYKKNYELALEHLTNVKTEHIPRIKNETYFLKTAIFFELNNLEQCIYTIDAHNHFLRNNKANSDIIKQRFLNFNHIVSKLVIIKSGAAKADIHNLKFDVNNTKPIYNPAWLLEKIAELEVN